jgi:glyoxylate/hydroxypyruvate reductase
MSLLLAIRGWDQRYWQEKFQALLHERRVLLPDEVSDPAYVEFIAAWKHAPGSLKAYRNTRAVFSLGAGVDHLLSDRDLPDAPVVRIVDSDLTRRMTEWVVWQALDWLRQGARYRAQQQAGQWIDDREQPSAGDISVGVMGLGELGMASALALHQIGFNVAGWSRTPKKPEGAVSSMPCFSGSDGLSTFLARTDILVCLMPLTPQTEGILNQSLLSGLKQGGRLGGPVLLNAGRGGLQDESAILKALDRGVLFGASLDVFRQEPLPAGSPFYNHPKVRVTPHNSAMSHPDAIAGQIVQQIHRLDSGGTLLNVVDRQAGY